jgi:hypothetical protein
MGSIYQSNLAASSSLSSSTSSSPVTVSAKVGGAAVAQGDLVSINSAGLIGKVANIDQAVFTSGTIAGQGSVGGGGTIAAANQKIPAPVLRLASGNFIVATVTASYLTLYLYSPTGVQLATTGAIDSGTPGSVQLLQLSNGNVAVVFQSTSTSSARFAIVTPALVRVGVTVTAFGYYAITDVLAACALVNGGFVICGRAVTTQYLTHAIYDNSGNAVLSATTVSAGAGTYTPKAVALSSGDYALVWSTSVITAWVYAVFSSTGGIVQGAIQFGNSTTSPMPQIAAMSGYFAIGAFSSSSGTGVISVYNNVGVLQGTEFQITGTTITPQSVVSDGTQFWCGSISSGVLSLTNIPITGGAGGATRNITVPANYSTFAMSYDSSLSKLVCVAGSTGAYATQMWSVDTTSPTTLYTAATTIGITAPSTAGSSFPNIVSAGDAGYIAYWDHQTTPSMQLWIGKFEARTLLGVAASAGAPGATISVNKGPAALTCNAVAGSTPRLFDHSWAGLNGGGCKGTLTTSTSITLTAPPAGQGSPSVSCPQSMQFGSGNILYFNASSTFVVPAGVSAVRARCWGGGGGAIASYGAGGAGFAMKVVAGLVPGAAVAVTVGAGWAGGTTGGTSSFGPYVSATGGVYGLASGSAGGSGIGGDINRTGGIVLAAGAGGGGAANYFGNGGQNGASGCSGGGGAASANGGSGLSGQGGTFIGTAGYYEKNAAPATPSLATVLDLVGTGGGGGGAGSNWGPGWNGGGGGTGSNGGFPGGGAGAGAAPWGGNGLVTLEW